MELVEENAASNAHFEKLESELDEEVATSQSELLYFVVMS